MHFSAWVRRIIKKTVSLTVFVGLSSGTYFALGFPFPVSFIYLIGPLHRIQEYFIYTAVVTALCVERKP